MQNILISILLGVVEGITEFLPVSSTAHIRLVQNMLGIAPDDPFWKMYAVVIQLGAVLCLPTYFWSRILTFVKSFGRDGKPWIRHPLTMVMIAFVCTAVPALLLNKLISANLESFAVMAIALILGGAVMWTADRLFAWPKTSQIEHMNLVQAVWIGLLQTVAAVFPGTSRSMATIAAGQSAGLTRAAALEFSFFLSMPTMAAACLYELYKTLKPSADGGMVSAMTGEQWIVLAVGFIVSYLVALAVVAWFMHYVRRHGFVPFAIYRIALGALVLLGLHFGWLV